MRSPCSLPRLQPPRRTDVGCPVCGEHMDFGEVHEHSAGWSFGETHRRMLMREHPYIVMLLVGLSALIWIGLAALGLDVMF